MYFVKPSKADDEINGEERSTLHRDNLEDNDVWERIWRVPTSEKRKMKYTARPEVDIDAILDERSFQIETHRFVVQKTVNVIEMAGSGIDKISVADRLFWNGNSNTAQHVCFKCIPLP